MNKFAILAAGLISLTANPVFAYGNNAGSGHHCDKPLFTDFQPAANKYLQSFNEFSFIASANTTPASLEATITSAGNKMHFTHKDLKIEPMKSGRFEVTGKLSKPLGHGFIRLDFKAHSKPGCETSSGYLLRIQ